jgi:hypothetical protein
MAIRNLSGQQIINTAVAKSITLPRSNPDVLDIDRRAAATKSPVVSDLLIGTVQQIPLIIIVVPVLR